MTIVCIDDDPTEFESLQLALRDAQIPGDIVHISNGAEALAYARESTKRATAWIIDGKFPMNATERAEKIGPEIVGTLRALR